jgi:hypothetical protein
MFIAFLAGLFFQYSRLDGFLHLGTVGNRSLTDRLLRRAPTDEALPREKFLIIYDPTDVLSMYARHNMEKILTEKRKSLVAGVEWKITERKNFTFQAERYVRSDDGGFGYNGWGVTFWYQETL